MKQRINHIAQGLRALSDERLRGMRRGIEKESLRTGRDGALALTPHPAPLGSALMHPHITTDFSESQLEMITGVHPDVRSCLEELQSIHQFVYRAIGDEMLWVGSMPCGLPADETIPIARFGTSNVGRAKSVYRMGLGYRYGRRMQTISGIHYNWSIPGLSNAQYFALIRNFRRHCFLLLLLFGASPAVCASFVSGRPHELQTIRGNTLGLPYATSLRMGRLGYQSQAQASLAVSYNSLQEYSASVLAALTRPYPSYETLGIRNPGGEYNQLSTSLLQIENEFYGTIRPKRVTRSGERPLHALLDRGVEYVEVRCMDLDPFEPTGIGAATCRFIDLFLLHCLLADSPPDTPAESSALSRNQQEVSECGRTPGLRLRRGDRDVALAEWAEELLEELVPIATAVDGANRGSEYAEALAAARAALAEPTRLPSARVLAAMHGHFDDSYVRFIDARSQQTKDFLLGLPWRPEEAQRFARLSEESVAAQAALEAADSLSFEDYLQRYLAPRQLTA